MASGPKRKSKRGNRMATQASKRRTLEDRLRGITITQLVLGVAAILVALGTIMNGTGLLLDYSYRAWISGPMPYAARLEVEDVRKLSAKEIADLAASTANQNAQTTASIAKLTDRSDETAQRGARVAQVLQSLQLAGLRTKLAEAKADSEAHPDSDAARKLVLTYQQELDELEKMSMP